MGTIKQPNNVTVKYGSTNGQLVWNPSFAINRSTKLNLAQNYIDSECIRLMIPYTPMQSGALFKSATLGTKIGSGHIRQNAPYARYQYYGMLMVSSVTGSAYATGGESKVLTSTPLNYDATAHPLAGKMWFERMKADKKQQILRGACKIAGGTLK